MLQDSGDREVQARIVYWGTEGSGKTESLRTIYARLRPDRRGVLRAVPTRLDPSVSYEELPIELGSIQGVRTQLKVIAVPGSEDQAHTRKQLLDRADGIVLVLDCRNECLEKNVSAVDELRRGLEAYGRSLSDIPIVVQYNKRDLSDPYSIEALHRCLGLRNAAVFETVATEGSGILQCLTTISKRVVRVLRERRLEPEPPARPEPQPVHEAATATPAAPASHTPAEAAPAAQPEQSEDSAPDSDAATPAVGDRSARDLMEQAILQEGAAGIETLPPTHESETVLDRSFEEIERAAKRGGGARIGADLKIVSVGQARRTGERSIKLPIVLGNDEGESVTLALELRLDPLMDDEGS